MKKYNKVNNFKIPFGNIYFKNSTWSQNNFKHYKM